MAIDDVLTNRLHDALEDLDNISRKKMMGGVCFMLNGNMVGGADRNKNGVGRFMFRVGKENEPAALKLPGAQSMEQGGRKMSGFFFVPEEICDETVLEAWVTLALSFAKSLPPK